MTPQTPIKENAVTNLFLMELDAFLSSHVQSEISCRDLKRGMYAIAMKHRSSKSTKEVLDIVRHVADQCVHNDTVNIESLRRTISGETKKVVPYPVQKVPRGYVIPRGVRYDGQRPGWIRDSHHGWLMPISDVYKLKMYKHHQMQHLQTRLVQWSLILGFIALACFVVSLYRAHVRVYHSNDIPKNLTQTDIDRQFLQAPPPTMLEVRSISTSPVVSTSLPIQYSQMPNTTDLMRDFSQIKS